MTIWAAALLVGFTGLLSFALTELVRRYAVRAGVLDQPNTRSSHAMPTPRGGGLAILTASSAAVALGAALGMIGWSDAVTLAVGAWALGIIGWVDDHRSLSAATRMGVHIMVAAWTLYRFGGLPVIHAGASTIRIGPAGYLVGAVGLVWSINLFNFMDGIDGLAGSQAAIIFAALGVLLLRAGDPSLGLIALVLAAGSLGFLPWNWPPARIFLGDVGSGPIGYLVGGIAIASENRGEVPLLVAIIITAAFVVDATVTLIRRILRRERLSQAHRNHAYQRLSRSFNSHGVVSVGAAATTAFLATLGAVATYRASLLLPALLITAAILVGILLYAERREPMTTSLGAGAAVPKKALGGERQRFINS